ncbi:MAG: hypothetical protein GVY12_06530 [Bacteroidetes bacterium]|nr:hypothetical protein [Bacteroidota bacterium]
MSTSSPTSDGSVSSATLGIHVWPERLDGVLVHRTGDAVHIVRHFSRSYARTSGRTPADKRGSGFPSALSRDPVDFTLEIGDDAARPASSASALGREGDLPAGVDFAQPLLSMLDTCRELGYADPALAFCIGAPDVGYAEVVAPPDTPTTGPSGWARWRASAQSWLPGGTPVAADTLHARLQAAYDTPFDPERVRFLPMASSASEKRHLALVPAPDEPVAPTLKALESDPDATATEAALEAEATVLHRAVDDHLAPSDDDHTVVVRVGPDDTLILFLDGTVAQQVERLPSLTAYDAPNTICSRVLLKQDEHQIDDIDHVVVTGSRPAAQLSASFRATYPDAVVHELADCVRVDVHVGEPLPPEASVLALLAALQHEGRASASPSATDLLSSPGHRRSTNESREGVAWHTVAMLLVLLGTTMFFTWRYVEGRRALADAERAASQRVRAATALAPNDLKQRVDSLNRLHRRYSRSLEMLDSLLVGSDEWSRTMARIAQQTDSIAGIWFERWTVDEAHIELRGLARSRSNLAALARNLDGTIETLEFAIIDGVRVYPFTFRIPRAIELPPAAQVLRERSLAPANALPTPSAASSD